MKGSSYWVPVEEQRCYGVVLCCFGFDKDMGPSYLRANLGQTIHIYAESNDWFLVSKSDESNHRGIIPKSYVHIQDSHVLRQGESDIIIPKAPPLVQEMTDVLREWHKHAKLLYLSHYQDSIYKLGTIRRKIMELHNSRRILLFPSWTVEGLKELKKKVAQVIDSGNSLLGLDMSVRDEDGNPLNPSVTSAIRLFREHQKIKDKLEKIQNDGTIESGYTIRHHSQSLLVSVSTEAINFFSPNLQKYEGRFFLYDAVEGRAFSEWAQVDLGSKASLKFLFTDLGKKDRERSKIYLVTYIVRIGTMFPDEIKKDVNKSNLRDKPKLFIKRPWGLGALNITDLFKAEEPTTPVKKVPAERMFMPFISYAEDSLKNLLTRTIENPPIKDIDRGFNCVLTLISGSPAEIREERPHLLTSNFPIICCRKMGFPEVILPNDIRNDLYVTLCSGEFTKGNNKTSDKNIQVTVSAHTENGDIIPATIHSGCGSTGRNDYKSTVYYHEDRPRWDETIKVTLPLILDQFTIVHLKFSFRHRSSKDTRDSQEKPFALSYVRLVLDDGTALADGEHHLTVYKIDGKHYRENEVGYLKLPSMLSGGHSAKRTIPGLSWSPKDKFSISTILCSTQFTQNDHLLKLLQWNSSPKSSADHVNTLLLNDLKKKIDNVQNVSGDEIVKFLPYVFNALFSILVEPIEGESGKENGNLSESDSGRSWDRPVFDCLIYIFGLILDHKYQNFKPVLCHYIEEEFSATMAYIKLLKELRYAIMTYNPEKVTKLWKCLEFFIKFIVRSFSIRIELRDLEIDDETESKVEIDFEDSVEELFKTIGEFLGSNKTNYVMAQRTCIKFIPTVIEPLVSVFNERKLSELLVDLIRQADNARITKQKLSMIVEIVKSTLFQNSAARTTLLPIVTKNIRSYLPGNDEDLKQRIEDTQVSQTNKRLAKRLGLKIETLENMKKEKGLSEEAQKCTEVLGDVMDILFKSNIGSTQQDVSYMAQILLRDIIYSIGTIGVEDAMAGSMVSILISLLRQMPPSLFSKLMHSLKAEGSGELYKFIHDTLIIFNRLFLNFHFPPNWSDMILLQNHVLLGALEQFSETIRTEFSELVEEQIPEHCEQYSEPLWTSFFQGAVGFITQEALQLDQFSTVKCLRILTQYGDMRLRAAELLRQMWFSLGERKRTHFVPSIIGTFLDMALVPEPTLRRMTIPIFYDMMRCNFDMSNTFQPVEDELINRLVEAIEMGQGDTAFRDIFYEEMKNSCENDNRGLRDSGLKMVETIRKLINRLLEYREVMNEHDSGNRITCIVNLLDFSMEMGRKELYLRYLYKLHNLHIENSNFTEAAFTLKLHSRQLEWTEESVPTYLISPIYQHANSQMELKEILYKDIIDYFDNDSAKMWECAIEIIDELKIQYAEEVYNYAQLPELLRRMATLYEKILNSVRFETLYFRVAYFGRGFPSFLQDKIFVYRGKQSETLNDFEARMIQRFPHAELLRSLNRPSDEQRNSSCQLLQICTVKAVMDSNKRLSGMKYAEENICKYYRSNDVSKFVYSRPYHKEPKDPKNEFMSLWQDRYTLSTSSSFPGIMSCFPVEREINTQIKPISGAIETIEATNNSLRSLVLAHCGNSQEDLGPLSLKLNGVVDAAVNGGISMYEKAFFIPEYVRENPGDADKIIKLKNLILKQVPVLSQCLKIHREKAPETLRPLQQKLEDQFSTFLNHIDESYGVSTRANELRDEELLRDIERAQKKRLTSRSSHHQRPKDALLLRSSDGIGSRTSVSGAGLARSKASFSSSVSIHKNSATKSMMSIPKPQRRSTFDENVGNTVRNGSFAMGASMNKLFSISGESECDINNKSSLQMNSIRLSGGIQWDQNGRSSGISISSSRSMTITDPSPRNSTDEFNEETECVLAPPLPPKSREPSNISEDAPPLPPKKPLFKNVEASL